jgi:hypothetical protein
MKRSVTRIEMSRWAEGEVFGIAAPFRRLARRRPASARRLAQHVGIGPLSPDVTPKGAFGWRALGQTHVRWPLWGVFVLSITIAISARAQQTNSPTAASTNRATRQDFSSFKIISDRNIFNSGRSGRPSRSGGGEPSRQAKVDSFSLVGTLSYEKGWFAFFDGTGSEYKKVLKRDGAIAGYKVIDISPAQVKLKVDDKEIEMRVGTQMRRQDEGEWQLVAQTGSYATASKGSSSPRRASSGSDADSASSGDESDVLKRMMQKREAEENK